LEGALIRKDLADDSASEVRNAHMLFDTEPIVPDRRGADPPQT